MGKGGKIARALVLFALVVLAAGCGGGASTGGGTDGTDGGAEVFYPNVQGPGREFLIADGDNLVQAFGDEASAGERAKASRVVQAWMKARVAEDWAEDCKYFSRSYARALVKDANGVTEGKVKSCPAALDYFGPEASGTSGNTLTGPIDSLRVKGPRAYAQWHGPEEDWVLPMKIEDGAWWVDIAGPIERTK